MMSIWQKEMAIREALCREPPARHSGRSRIGIRGKSHAPRE
jgi:hypothetical protein